jgi:hypothetical protein
MGSVPAMAATAATTTASIWSGSGRLLGNGRRDVDERTNEEEETAHAVRQREGEDFEEEGFSLATSNPVADLRAGRLVLTPTS